MSDSSHDKTCPDCGTRFSPGAPEDQCPRCLMAQIIAPTQGGDQVAPAPAPAPEDLAPHFPQLEIIGCLGRGGMGVVYKARQKSLNRLVALKLLAPERAGDPPFAARFEKEAQALAALNHPHIVTIHDYGGAGGFFYLLMEFVDGVNLRQAMRAGHFTPEQALAIVPPVCEALQYAHEHGIVHRDIKPENLLLDKEGRVKIADFGIAKMLGTDAGAHSPRLSRAGFPGNEGTLASAAGTPQYMAPEQKEHRATDHRADIYSLGVVLYELLTGELPADKLQPPSHKVRIDVRLDEIVLRALEKTPELRYQTAGEFRTQVQTIPQRPPDNSRGQEFPPEKPEITNHPSAIPPRFSRTAIVGVCWAAAGAIHFLVPTLGYRMKSEFVPIMMITLGLSAPIGTTILGWIAVLKIRRSAGRSYGLRLAVFDGLFFPLLFLVVAVAFTLGLFIAELKIGLPKSLNVGVLALLASSPLCWFIIRRVWRKVKQPLTSMPDSRGRGKASSESPAEPESQRRLTPAATSNQRSICGACALGLFIGAMVGAPLLRGYLGAQEVIVLCGLTLLVSLVLGLVGWRSKSGRFAVIASGLGLLLLVAFTFNYLNPRPPRDPYEGGPMVERVKFSFNHPEALLGGHELTLPTTTRLRRWVPYSGQPLSLTKHRQVLTRVRVLESNDARVTAEAACSEDGTNWETQMFPLSADAPKGKLRFKNDTEATVEWLGAGMARSGQPPTLSSDPVVERDLHANQETLANGFMLRYKPVQSEPANPATTPAGNTPEPPAPTHREIASKPSPASTRLQFRPVADEKDANAETLPRRGGKGGFRVGRGVWLDETSVRSAAADQKDANHGVSVNLTEAGARKFAEVTAAHTGRQLAIVFDGTVMAEPLITSPITGGGVTISGNFTAGEAESLAEAMTTAIQTAAAKSAGGETSQKPLPLPDDFRQEPRHGDLQPPPRLRDE